jgi:mannitol/fructose-specific phosphotransferase system IIA component (Ntr-type)
MSSIAAQLLQPGRISLDIAAKDEQEAILEVAGILRKDADVIDFDTFCRELMVREKMRSTAAGYGVAFPHARTDAVKEIVVAAGRSLVGVKFGEEVVNFIFVIGTPREKAGEYLVAVGTLARLLRSEKLRAALTKAATPEDFIRALGGR